jgi:hypothetical protein
MTLSSNIAQILLELFDELEWEDGDMLNIQIAGSSTSGIDVGEDFNPKWSRPLGTVKHNKDAVIVIKNVNRSPVVSSLSKAQQDKLADDKANYDTSSK